MSIWHPVSAQLRHQDPHSQILTVLAGADNSPYLVDYDFYRGPGTPATIGIGLFLVGCVVLLHSP